jgi:hypothetical protein
MNEKPSIFIPCKSVLFLGPDQRARSVRTGCAGDLPLVIRAARGSRAMALSLLESKAYGVVHGAADGVRPYK